MAQILHIETSTKVCSVALSNEGELVDYSTEQNENFAHSERLTVVIQELIDKNELNFSNLDAISVSSGPGSYTGLRIGVSTAKGLCYALDIPLLAIDSLSALYYFNKLVGETANLHLCMIDARRMEAYTAIFDNFDCCLKPVSADILEVNYLEAFHTNQSINILGDGQFKCKEIWGKLSNVNFSELQADARGQIEQAYAKFLKQDYEDLIYFEPKYFKDFQAVVKKK